MIQLTEDAIKTIPDTKHVNIHHWGLLWVFRPKIIFGKNHTLKGANIVAKTTEVFITIISIRLLIQSRVNLNWSGVNAVVVKI